jgi:RNA polymerase sigma factor (sigma-70 family)
LNPFRPIPAEQLNDLTDEDLIAYVLTARGAGEDGEAVQAIQVLVYGYRRDIERRVRIRMKRHAVDEVADMALVRALGAVFGGESVGQFRSWLNTIVDRTVADWYRRAERRPVETALPSEHEGEDEVWSEQPASELDWLAGLHARDCLDRTLASLRGEHRAIVELYWFADADARTTAEQTGQSEANVYQVAKRFKESLRECLEEGGDTSSPSHG